ncbi:metal-dependent transcriptional regulator [Cuniculiplasma sp. SKW3]|uniref:metal-dependent transcriptional regulator n=1 Tax=Cuniculiplasma sp. SKW3 TaxID=3400170 RepID=UPI003FD2630E
MHKQSITTEDYLKSIHELTEYRGYASLTDIGKILGTARQSVYDEINIMLDKKLVRRLERGKYVLTEKGQMDANKFLRKHRIAEILLFQALSMNWEHLDDQAMGIEHGMTEEIMDKVCEKYGCIKCPHGNPVPDRNGFSSPPQDMKMSGAIQGEKYTVSRVIFEEKSILSFLNENQLYPGTEISYTNDGHWELNGKKINFPENVADAIRIKIKNST